jgi:hypothetical protein
MRRVPHDPRALAIELEVHGREWREPGHGRHGRPVGCGTGGNQQWTFEDASGGYKRLKVSHSDQCLDLASQSTANNVGLVQNSCGSGQSCIFPRAHPRAQ